MRYFISWIMQTCIFSTFYKKTFSWFVLTYSIWINKLEKWMENDQIWIWCIICFNTVVWPTFFIHERKKLCCFFIFHFVFMAIILWQEQIAWKYMILVHLKEKCLRKCKTCDYEKSVTRLIFGIIQRTNF